MLVRKQRYWWAGLILLYLFNFSRAVAQTSALKFDHLSFREGLAQSPISTIFQDQQGFVWIGNWKGLTRYDGYGFRRFKHQDGDSLTLSNNRVNSICQDVNRYLWVATSNGLNRYDTAAETFRHVGILNIKGGRNFASSVIQDADHNLWVATFGGVKQVDTAHLQLTDLPSLKSPGNDEVANGITFTLYQDRLKAIWIGLRKGVKRFDPRTKKLLTLPNGVAQDQQLMNAKVLVIRQDRKGCLWFGTETSGVFRYDPASDKCMHYRHVDGDGNSLRSDWIKSILVRNDNTVWIGTRQGLSIFDQEHQRFANYTHDLVNEHSLTDNTIWSFLQDKAGGVWIGTFAGGINIHYPANNNFTNIGERVGAELGLNHPVVNAVLEYEQRNLWIGTYGGGVNLIDRRTNKHEYYSVKNIRQGNSSNGVKCIADDHKGNLWIGTFEGLCRFNKVTKAATYYKFPTHEGKLTESLVNCVLPEVDGVWAGTNGGGLQFLKPDGSFVTMKHDASNPRTVSDNFITSLIHDAQGNVWIGTQNGLNHYDRSKKQITACYKHKGEFSLTHGTVTNLFYDPKGRLWVGTEGGGLNCYDARTRHFYAIDARLGITDEVIHTTVADREGNIWTSTDDGLFRIRLLNDQFPFTASNTRITRFSSNDGLASNQFLSNSGILSQNGELLFGGINGLTIFHPGRLLKNTYKPPVVITGLSIRNKPVVVNGEGSPLKRSITGAQELKLKYDQGYFTLDLAALNYNDPSNNQYAYRLKGSSDGDSWHYVGHQHSASYTDLPEGDYVFEVKAANNNGVWNSTPTKLHIVVLPPLWRTWWAYALYVILFMVILYVVIRFFRSRARLERDLYHEHLHNERQEELYRSKLNFFTNISHEIRTPLTLIIGPLERLMEATRENAPVFKQLGTVRNNADRLMRLVTELLDLRKAEEGHLKLYYAESDLVSLAKEIYLSFQDLAVSKNIDYTFQSFADQVFLYFDKDQLEKVFFNLLSNAFKFTPNGGRITLTIAQAAGEVVVTVTDNGKGIPEHSQKDLFKDFFQVDDPQGSPIGTGIGLALSRNIVELHGGSISVDSKLAEAGVEGMTTFTVTLKQGKAHLDASRIVDHHIGADEISHYQIHSQANGLAEQQHSITSNANGSTILVVEDNDEVRQFIIGALQEKYRVIGAANGTAGLAEALMHMPDLIVTDVMMPEMDGTELCRMIKTDERLDHIPVIMLTARAGHIHQLSGYEHGADAYVTKPFSVQLLQLQVSNILSSKKALRQKYARELLLQPQRPADVLSPDEKFLRKLMAVIEKNMEDPEFGVTGLMDQIGMSKNVLYKKVQVLTNMSVADLIKSVRLKQAAQLLDQQNMGIAEVAFAVGFNDRKYFSKEFKKQFDLSPSEYVASKAATTTTN
ncbi:response regulator [Mucilaginibacter daejeonensis]|uniref:two-component regulator propeller domain-containing protein n=1 Tax=Mucilaginibacter daejeonensis TaxID=398049 RepID=UPI001D1765A5|nr:two-component regulator propeller domain-containing protein [Mucilaginibacter daejeonensis]UEG54807.1 response regulator [Mucilaginibacter daejeonensis]